ncbi:MAG: PAS domain S-box protein [Bacteroidota bacterium]|jgi:PAS domain S-box-containing protein|nr:PAS domain S-box protein [Bacteroidota bacterium]
MLDHPPTKLPEPSDGLDALLETVRRDGDFALSQFWCMTHAPHTATCIAGRHDGQERDARFLQFNMRVRLRAAAALPLRTFRETTARWHADLSNIDGDPRRERMHKAGYVTGVAVPVTIDDGVVGVIECFTREMRSPNPALLDRLQQRIADAGATVAAVLPRVPGSSREGALQTSSLQPFMEQELRLLFQTAPLGIVVTDEEDFILEVNTRFCEIFGLVESDIVGSCFSTLLQPDTPLPTSTAYRDVREGRVPRAEVEKRYHRGDRVVDARLHLTGMTVTEGNVRAWYCMRLIEDISEKRRLQEQLRMAETLRSDELQLFALRLQKAQEEERRRIASDLHDDLCQQLSGMKLNIEVFEDDVRASSEHAFQRLQLMKAQLERMIDTVRRMSSSLRPSVLDDFGLLPALRVMAKEQQELHGIHVRVHAEGYEHTHALHEHETALYRIVQEALSNIVQHASASDARIDLVRRDRELALHIRDNGIGFSPKEVRYTEGDMRGMGLVGMRERARQLHGHMEIHSLPGSGTEIIVRLPCPGKT